MENKANYIFAIPQQPHTNDQSQSSPHQLDIKNLQKVVLQSFKYCQAKKSKNRYIRSKKVQEMKSYQKKLIAIIKRKSQQAIASLMAFSNEMVLEEETLSNESSKIDEQTLLRLKQKLTSLKEVNQDQSTPNIMRQKLKRVTFECEEELQKMQSSQTTKKTDIQIQKLINKMQRPFKKLCSYFSLLTKDINELKETSQAALVLRKTDSQQTE